MNFKLTDAGRASIADAANRRTNQVVFTRLAIGDGLGQPGVADSGRVSLRNERQRQGLTAVTGGVARIGVRASFTGMMGGQVWNATEVGLIAQVGVNAEFLAAYGAVEAGADAYAVVAPGVSSVIAATVHVVVAAAAVAVAVTPDVTVEGASTFAALLDTPAALTPLAYYRVDAAGLAFEAQTAADLAAEIAPYFPALVVPDTDFLSSAWQDVATLTIPRSTLHGLFSWYSVHNAGFAMRILRGGTTLWEDESPDGSGSHEEAWSFTLTSAAGLLTVQARRRTNTGSATIRGGLLTARPQA